MNWRYILRSINRKAQETPGLWSIPPDAAKRRAGLAFTAGRACQPQTTRTQTVTAQPPAARQVTTSARSRGRHRVTPGVHAALGDDLAAYPFCPASRVPLGAPRCRLSNRSRLQLGGSRRAAGDAHCGSFLHKQQVSDPVLSFIAQDGVSVAVKVPVKPCNEAQVMSYTSKRLFVRTLDVPARIGNR